jgi:hypothetical protein
VVPVVDRDQRPLMPCTERRARQMVASKKATPFWRRGIFCIRLNVEPAARRLQQVVVGIDPGSKKEGYTVKSEAHTYLNIQADAVVHVSDAVETRRNMRRARRFRKTPCRANRQNRARGCLPPSTRARWQWKLRIVEQLAKILPITDIVVEDIKARTKGKRKWDSRFSPLEVGKTWFYAELKRFGTVHLVLGYETKRLRDVAGLKKSKAKMSEVFEAHCVDSWVLANWLVGGHLQPENRRMRCVSPIRLHRRQLHMRGSLVAHPVHGLCYVGGTMGDRISLHSSASGKRLCQNAKPADVRFKAYNPWRTRLLPALKGGVSAAEKR